jgi:hypothetical protein
LAVGAVRERLSDARQALTEDRAGAGWVVAEERSDVGQGARVPAGDPLRGIAADRATDVGRFGRRQHRQPLLVQKERLDVQ